jgi:hypothetical protein
MVAQEEVQYLQTSVAVAALVDIERHRHHNSHLESLTP